MGRKRLSIVVAGMAIVAAGTGVAVAGNGGKGPIDNPDEQRSFAERDQKYRDASDSFDRRYREWFSSPHTTVDPRTLPRGEMLALQVAGADTFAAALERAALAVSGQVISVRFEPYRTITEFRVDRHAIGEAGEVLTFLQGGYLWPERDFIGAHLVEASGTPLLLTGDRAVLLLDRSAEGDLYIQGFSGWYRIQNGKTASVKGNKFRTADGLTADQLMDRIQARAERR
jgi:hypothetical protein